MAPTLLVTRPEPDATRCARQLEAIGITPVLSPMLDFEAFSIDLPDPRGLTGIVLTSANALRALPDGQLAPLLDLPVFTVGDHTADTAREAGFRDVRSADGALRDLAALIIASGVTGTLFYPAARERSGDLAPLLAPFDLTLDLRVAYGMNPAAGFAPGCLDRLFAGEIAGAVFYSARTAANFARLTEGADFEPLRRRLECLCMAEAVAAPLVAQRFTRLALADHPSHEAMMALALTFARGQIKA